MDIAYDYFMKCAYIDLHNLYGNTRDGFHLATAGGVWQILFRGFCGVDIKNDTLEIRPNLPPEWKKVELRFRFRGNLVDLKIGKGRVVVRVIEGERFKIRTSNGVAEVKSGETVVLEV